MNSASRTLMVRVPQDPLRDHVGAFRTALELFGVADSVEFLPPRDDPRYWDTLCELVCIELTHGWRTGAPTGVDAYRARFPELFANSVLAYRIMQVEFLLRREAGAVAETPALSPLDPAASSNFDLVFTEEDVAHYPLTSQPVPSVAPVSWASGEIVPTRLGRPAENRLPGSSDPEVIWKLNQAMHEMPKVGDEFLGFSLLAELGTGAFGKVFLAQQGALAGRLVALKIAAGLFSESQTLAQLQHTHIVPIYSYHHGQPFQAVCMPYLGSTTLAHVLADIRAQKSMPSSGKELISTLNIRRKSTRKWDDSTHTAHADWMHDQSMDASEAAAQARPAARVQVLEGMSYVDSILWLAVRLADGLAHAHEQGIIHRDLKPANVLLTDDGLPMLLDFNLAQDNKLRGGAAAASIGGTLPYMAPEHLEAFRGNPSPVDARSDLYSFGVILFELLTGAAPFPSYRKLSTRDTVDRMLDDRRRGAPRLRSLNKNVSPAVEAIVLRCLEADPAKRYQTVRQLQEDLQCQLDHEPLRHASNPSLRERFRKFRTRHPRLASATTVAAVAVLLIAGMASAFSVREESLRRLEARETLTRFDDDAQTAYFLLHARTAGDQLDEGKKACYSTLEHFQVLENPDWRRAPPVRRLSPEQQARLHGEVGQLLVLLAHAQQLAGEREPNAEKRQALFQEGLQYCSLAQDCFGDAKGPLALWKQQGELHRRLDQRDKADECFERARQTEFKTAQDRYLTARLLAEEGKFRAALPLLAEAIRLNPQDFNLHFLQGICHDYLAQHAEAIACYRTCIALRPQFYASYYNRGLTYLRQGNAKAALADLDHAIRLNADFVEAYSQRALALESLGKYREAIADLSVALHRGDAPTRIYFLRAKLRDRIGDVAGAKSDRAEGLRREPTDERSWIARGIAWLPDNPEKAIHDFDKAIELEPRSLAALHNKAHVQGKYLKQTDDAVKTLDKAVLFYPDDVRPRAGRGVYLARLGQRDAALKDAEHALSLDRGPAVQYEVAGIYALTAKQEPSDRQESLRLLSAALKKGFGFEYLETDRDLDPIRESLAFRQVVQAARALRSAPARP